MRMPFRIEMWGDEEWIVVLGEWKPAIPEYMREHNSFNLCFNYSQGWWGKDLDFLAEVPEVKQLNILDWGLENLQGIEGLPNLESISLTVATKAPLDFTTLPSLRECWMEWRKGWESIFECEGLRDLSIYQFPMHDTECFKRLTKLEKLKFGNGRCSSLEGLARLTELRYLEFFLLPKLESLKGIEGLSKLEDFRIGSCKRLTSLEELSNFHHLKMLCVGNCSTIETLAPLKTLNELERFLFIESTNIEDGDLSPLTELPALRYVAFMDRRHYSHKNDELNAILDQSANAARE